MEIATCPICGQEEETAMHVVWQCPAARDVWAVSFKAAQKWPSAEEDFLLLWDKFMDRLTDEELEFAAVLTCLIWLRRNSFIFEDKFKDPGCLVRTANAMIDDFREAQRKRWMKKFLYQMG